MDFWTDPLILAAGNARSLPGGDPDAHPSSPEPTIPGQPSAEGPPKLAARPRRIRWFLAGVRDRLS